MKYFEDVGPSCSGRCSASAYLFISMNTDCPGYDIKLHPVVEFRREIMRLPFAAATSMSPLSKV